ncbi:prolipoprotein diacylglyceryl transferase [Deinococcus peraridilitoris]|uniref:Phosphatidylglycerol--prolipoprotein diacylglyceryl transferase n=1 Tax=Deinococcus peraridilitoris (strain DSM 19664 / LMG 22246 / CIP 109416 / KR-200) TaxID=937777 RepID=K9ZY98_DEIPD|nr:prolipoprotein diacylglyceryl transferase [Deinococcus peraridilitoris]AFZ66159.1 prolipoprotein diacylglyceryl transferase [Deinococcus peraridilitoris DSM 19664]
MDPVAIQIGGFTIAWYGILITAGILIGAVIATRLARARGLNVDLLSDMMFWEVVWGVVGARIVFILTSPQNFQNASLLDYLNIRQGGISIHGGLIGGILVLLYYARRYRVNLYRYAELMIPGVALGIIGGRIGNIMNGSDTVGRVTGWPIGYVWPGSARSFHDTMCNPNAQENLAQYCQNGVVTAPVHFTQLYGVFIGVALLIASYFWLRSYRPGWAFWQFWLWYSLLRAGLEETFRLNPLAWNVYLEEGLDAPGIGLFTSTHLASVPIILVAIYMLYRISRQPAVPHTPEPVRDHKTHAKRV